MNKEIEGFYHDPATGRYYRKLPGTSAPPIIPTISKAKEVDPFTYTFPKPKNLINLLNNREYGFRYNTSFDLPYLKLKTKSVELTKSENVFANAKLSELFKRNPVGYLKGGKKSIYVMWNPPQANHNWSFIGEVLHDSSSEKRFKNGLITTPASTVDFCEGSTDPRCFFSISNNLQTGYAKTQILCRQITRAGSYTEAVISNSIKTTVWSCCFNSFSDALAVGCEDNIWIDTFIGFSSYDDIKGNYHALQYDESGKILFCGIHTGKLIIRDFRANGSVVIKKLYNTGVDEIILLSDERTLICGTFDGTLCKYDLRKMRIFGEYYGHVHTPKKVPFSISESYNLLCATGSDNITRLWSLGGGHPIKTLTPPDAANPHYSWLMDDERSATLHVMQQNKKFRYKIGETIELNE